MATCSGEQLQSVDSDWVAFPGGELEGRRPRRLCHECRERQNRHAATGGDRANDRPPARATLCFQCYRLELDREKALKAAGDLDTASETRFQFTLPWEPVDVRRLSMLKAARRAERMSVPASSARFEDRRRRAQIAARHALQVAADGLRSRGSNQVRASLLASLSHAAELQLPESWLPFVMARS